MANPTLVFPGLSCVLAFHYSTPSNPDSYVPKHFTSGETKAQRKEGMMALRGRGWGVGGEYLLPSVGLQCAG